MTFICIELRDPISKCLYEETNTAIELWTKIIFKFCIYVMIPAGGIPVVGLSYYFYFTTDLGKDAFIMLRVLK